MKPHAEARRPAQPWCRTIVGGNEEVKHVDISYPLDLARWRGVRLGRHLRGAVTNPRHLLGRRVLRISSSVSPALPAAVSAGLNRWRMRGLAGVIAGALLIYYGARAL